MEKKRKEKGERQLNGMTAELQEESLQKRDKTRVPSTRLELVSQDVGVWSQYLTMQDWQA